MEVFHVGDKVFLDDARDYKYGKVVAVDTENNLMRISPINELGIMFNDIDSPHIHKIDFLPKDHVIIHDLMKDYCDRKGIVDAYDKTINRYRVMIDNEPHWFVPFELTLADNDKDNDDYKDNDDWSGHFVKSFLSSNPIKAKLSDEGKKAYEYHFGVKPSVDANGRTEFTNLVQFMEVFDPTFIYSDKYMLEDNEILVKVAD